MIPAGITIIWSGGHWAVPTRLIIACCFTLTVIDRCIANIYSWRNRVLHRAFERLEPYDGKLSCTVLRGLRRSNAPWLPDWVRSVRAECLDKLIILNERHLRRVLTEYLVYYNARRPHQGLDQDSPLGLKSVSTEGPIRHRNVLGGIIRDYYREAA